VEEAMLETVLPGQRNEQIELAVLVDGERAMVDAVGLCSRSAGEGPQLVAAQHGLVEVHGEKAARDVCLDGMDAVEADELAAHLVDAARAFRLTRQKQGQLEGVLGHPVLSCLSKV
jgi:hypothetical protein